MNDKNIPGALIEKLDVHGQLEPSLNPKDDGKVVHMKSYRRAPNFNFEKLYSTGPIPAMDKHGNEIHDACEMNELGNHVGDKIASMHEEKSNIE